jgi:folate/biopterin transporter
MELPSLPLRYKFINNHVEPSEYDKIVSTVMTPWVVKPLYGLVSDNIPIFGYKRKPYILLMNTLMCFLWFSILYIETIKSLTYTMFFLQVSLVFTDVMYDSLLVENSRFEETGKHGELQSRCWMSKGIGATLASILSGFLVKSVSFEYIILILIVFCSILIYVCANYIIEKRDSIKKDKISIVGGIIKMYHSFKRIFKVMTQPDMFRPALFIFVLGSTPSSSTPFFYFLVTKLNFDSRALGLISSVSNASVAFGSFLYGRFFRNVKFRKFFLVIVLISFVLSLTPIILVRGWNKKIKISDLWFVLGDDVFLATFGEIGLMPVLVLVAKMCPNGIEATIYASFVSILNVSGIISGYLGALTTQWFGVTQTNFEKLDNLILFNSFTSLIPILFILLVPKGNSEDILQESKVIGPRKFEKIEVHEGEINTIDAEHVLEVVI